MRRPARRTVQWLTLLAALPLVAAAQPPGDEFSAANVSTIVVTEPTKAKRLAGPGPVSVATVVDGDTTVTCRLRAWNRSEGRKGVKALLSLTLLDLTTGTVARDLGRTRLRTDQNGEASASYTLGNAGDLGSALLIATVDMAGGKRVTRVAATCGLD